MVGNKMTTGELLDVDNHQLISYTKRWINQTMIMGNNGSPAERQNLLGQLRSGILLCVKNGVIEEVLKEFPKEIAIKIINDYNIKYNDKLYKI
jgi:hypothetical protein